MNDWDAIRELGIYIGLEIDSRLFEKITSSPKSERSLELLRSSLAGAFRKKYDDKTVELLDGIIFGTDFSLLSGDGEHVEVLSRDVFRRLSWTYRHDGEMAYQKAFEEFNVYFRYFIRSFRATFKSIVYFLALKKEPVCLKNGGNKDYLMELKELPCRKMGELRFPDMLQTGTALYDYIETLLKKYEGVALEENNCRNILDILGKLSGFPGYFKALSPQQKLIETRPMILAISDLQLYPGKEASKNDLLSALAILLFNVYPTPKLLKFIVKFQPSPENELLSYEYNAILALNYLLWGKPNEAAAFNEKAMGFAADEEKRANTHILSSCIHLGRKDYNAALNALYNCTSLSKDLGLRSSAYFYMGLINYETGNAREALDCFKISAASLEEDTDLMVLCNNIGACTMALGDIKGAVKPFEKAIQTGRSLNSNTAKAYTAIAYGCLGIVRLSMGDYGSAIECCKASLKLHKDLHDKKRSADQLGNIGLALKCAGEYGHALEYFKSSLSVSFSDDYLEGVLFSFDQIEQLMAFEGRFEDAESFRQEVIRRNPGIAKMLKK
jgi:tetratricopeptide (TPR) repeat protein